MVDLPQAQAEALSEDSQPPVVASVDKDGLYYLDVGDGDKSPISPDELATLVAAHLQLRPDTPVVVKGDGSVAYEQVIRLMVILQQAGAPSVGLMTDPVE